ncbi:MAG: sigma factor-like helix-turn-helix DNA-binding protein [Byssovorax sp.]
MPHPVEDAPAAPEGAGVTVIVRPPRARPPKVAPPVPVARTRVVIRPPSTPADAAARTLDDLCREHGEFLQDLLARRKELKPESRKDLAQLALMVLCKQVAENGIPENPRGFLTGVVKKVVQNHKRIFRPQVEHDADAEAVAFAALDPEELAAEAELRRKLDRYTARLSDDEADVLRLVCALGFTVGEAATAFERSRGTVATQLARARAKLEAQAEESNRRVGGTQG